MSFEVHAKVPSPLSEPEASRVRDALAQSSALVRVAVDPTEARTVKRQGLDDARTSRSPVRLGTARWHIAQSIALDGNVKPVGLLAVPDRVLVVASDRIALFSGDGRVLATVLRGGGDAIVLPEMGTVLFPTTKGSLEARSLKDGTAVFKISAAFGDSHSRPYIAWHGNHLLMTGRKRLLPVERANAARPKPQVVLQIQELPATLEVDDGYLVGQLSDRTITRASDDLQTVIQGDRIYAATDNRLYELDYSLTVTAVVAEEFLVLAMSADEHRRVHMIVRTPARNELWVLTMDGARTIRLPLPPPRPGGYTPPIIGYDHTIMVPVDRRIVVINPDGRHVADYPISENFAGAVTTADDKLLVADGSKLVAYERDGRAHVVADLGDEIIRTAPALLGDGTAWLATSQHLYRLVPAP